MVRKNGVPGEQRLPAHPLQTLLLREGDGTGPCSIVLGGTVDVGVDREPGSSSTPTPLQLVRVLASSEPLHWLRQLGKL